MACESASAEMETDAGDNNGDDEVETEVFGGGLLVDKVGPCDSNKAKMLLKNAKENHRKARQKNCEESTETEKNCWQRRKTKENG